jgi:membrane protease YdiL (CAAX protease family)
MRGRYHGSQVQSILIGLFLVLVLGLFHTGVQDRLRTALRHQPARIFVLPLALVALFAGVLLYASAWSTAFLLLFAGYVLLPTALVYRNAGRQSWLDFAAILLLWLPIELTTGKELLPRHAWGLANVTARGSAITLALFLFLLFRDLKGMKYTLPRKLTDLLYPVLGFLVAAAVLIPLGLLLGFMGPFHPPDPFRPAAFGLLFLRTVLGVALPEELLFRSLIQNWLMQKFGFMNRTLLAAAVIFGFAHINNAPGGFPNWRYVILASIAGFIYGKVFQKSTSVLSSAGLHALVNAVRHTFFR